LKHFDTTRGAEMETKSFIQILIAVIVLGGALGGIFIGGIIMGRGQGNEITVTAPSPGPEIPDGAPNIGAIIERFQSGELTADEIGEIREQVQARLGQAGSGSGSAIFGGALTGTVEAIDGTRITMKTRQGDLDIIVEAEATIRALQEAPLSSISLGEVIAVVGDRTESGHVNASEITIVPEEFRALLGNPGRAGAGRSMGTNRNSP
jgi:hypothetical protein